jgi:hypothetical protein
MLKSQLNRKHNNKPLAVLVAKDVLKQIRYKNIFLTPGTYCKLEVPTTEEGKDLQTALKNKTARNCRVCGIGAAFISLVNLKNKFDITSKVFNKKSNWVSGHYDDLGNYISGYFSPTKELSVYIDRNDLTDRLAEVFSQKQLTDLEELFEGYYSCYNFAERYTPNERMIIIMKNIIKNKGWLNKEEVKNYTGKP